MNFSHVRKIVRPMGTVNDEFFFCFLFPALGVYSVLT